MKGFKEVEGGMNVEDLCREYEISEVTCDNQRSKYAGMEASDFKELKAEKLKLNRMYAELCLVSKALTEIVEKKL